jgi:hypothetical protein
MIRMKKVWQAVLVAAVVGGIGVAVLPSAAIAAGKCDGKAKPCPLQKFMRDNAGTPMASGELARVAESMEKIEKAGGPDMKDWAKLAKKTADDARANKTDDVKADCKACHDAYKQAYKNNVTLRNKPFP